MHKADFAQKYRKNHIMQQKMLYAFRGWIAFVAFMDLGTAGRSYIEKRSFLSKTLSDSDYVDGKSVRNVIRFTVDDGLFYFRGVHYIQNFGNLLYTKSFSTYPLHFVHTL